LTIEAEVGVACLMPSVIMVSRTAGASIGLEHSCDVAVACRISLLHQVVRTESSSILSPESLASRGSLLSTLQCDSLGTERIGLCKAASSVRGDDYHSFQVLGRGDPRRDR
jgi:hypothetical protein